MHAFCWVVFTEDSNKMARVNYYLHVPVFLVMLYHSSVHIAFAATIGYSDDPVNASTPSLLPGGPGPTSTPVITAREVVKAANTSVVTDNGAMEPTNTPVKSVNSATFSISDEVTAASLQEATIQEPPIPQRGKFTLRGEDGQVCLKAQFVIVIKVYYKSKMSEQEEASISLPANASVSGKCGVPEGISILTLTWSGGKYLLNFTFQETSEDQWVGKKIQFTYDKRDNPDFAKAVEPDVCNVRTDKERTYFMTKIGWSRTCRSEHDITLESVKKDRVVMQITELRLQPFGLVNGTFGTETHCKADKEKKNSNTASLVVGLLLAAFTIIVIIGYAVGRKTGYISERPGYSTME